MTNLSKIYNEGIEELLNRAREGDKEAQNVIVEENMGLVRSVVKRFCNRGYETEDLFENKAMC